jgi:hypothetical protein
VILATVVLDGPRVRSRICVYFFFALLLSVAWHGRSFADDKFTDEPNPASGGAESAEQKVESEVGVAGSQKDSQDASLELPPALPAQDSMSRSEESGNTLPTPLDQADNRQNQADKSGSSVEMQLSQHCGNGSWKLSEAGVNPNLDDDVTYNEKWTPVLEEIARCVTEQRTQRPCLDIQGHSDSIQFSPAVVAAYGSAQAAQMVRARSRSIMVIAKLYGMGVKPHLLRLIPPSLEPTYRGVSIELVLDCEENDGVLPDWISSPEALEQTLRRRGALSDRTKTISRDKAETDYSTADDADVTPPQSAVWLGVRMGIAVPAADLYRADADASGGPTYQDATDLGPSIELNAGIRLKQVFLILAFWEHAWLGGGSAEQWRDYAGGQQGQLTDYLGVAGRWSVQAWPRSSVNLELGTGYRWLNLSFSDRTEIDMGSPLETRLGVGLDYLMSSRFAVEVMLLASGGLYAARSFDLPDSGQLDLGGKDRFHAMFSFVISGHYDLPIEL